MVCAFSNVKNVDVHPFDRTLTVSISQAEVTQRLSNAKEAPSKPAGLQSHEDLARKLQVQNILLRSIQLFFHCWDLNELH